MGDHNAVDIAQESHMSVLRDSGLVSESVLLAYGDPFPEGSILEGVVIDDHVIAHITSRRKARQDSGRDKDMILKSHTAYHNAG
eukprot:8671301-Karenia_brevis.AAC.1